MLLLLSSYWTYYCYHIVVRSYDVWWIDCHVECYYFETNMVPMNLSSKPESVSKYHTIAFIPSNSEQCFWER